MARSSETAARCENRERRKTPLSRQEAEVGRTGAGHAEYEHTSGPGGGPGVMMMRLIPVALDARRQWVNVVVMATKHSILIL